MMTIVQNNVWKMFFDGSFSREGFGRVLISPTSEVIYFPYKLEFEATNNIAEYEALILGLRVAKNNGN